MRVGQNVQEKDVVDAGWIQPQDPLGRLVFMRVFAGQVIVPQHLLKGFPSINSNLGLIFDAFMSVMDASCPKVLTIKIKFDGS